MLIPLKHRLQLSKHAKDILCDTRVIVDFTRMNGGGGKLPGTVVGVGLEHVIVSYIVLFDAPVLGAKYRALSIPETFIELRPEPRHWAMYSGTQIWHYSDDADSYTSHAICGKPLPGSPYVQSERPDDSHICHKCLFELNSLSNSNV